VGGIPGHQLLEIIQASPAMVENAIPILPPVPRGVLKEFPDC